MPSHGPTHRGGVSAQFAAVPADAFAAPLQVRAAIAGSAAAKVPGFEKVVVRPHDKAVGDKPSIHQVAVTEDHRLKKSRNCGRGTRRGGHRAFTKNDAFSCLQIGRRATKWNFQLIKAPIAHMLF